MNYLVEVVPNFFEYKDRFKLDVFFHNMTKYNEMIVNTGSLIDNLKVRLFVHVSDIETTIFMELIVIPIGNMENCSGDFDWCFKKELDTNIILTKKNTNDHLCLLCISQKLITEVLNDLQNMLGKRLSSHGLIYNTKTYEWAFIAE